VQSDIRGRYGEIFGQILGDLNNGFKVLFTGTPCQIAGLKSYIPENLLERLFTLDFVCHGVSSAAVWKDYLDYMSRHGKIVKANFRDKSVAGWKEHKETFIYSNGEKKVTDSYRVLFYKNIMLRHSCAVCPYNIKNHKSDVTIADFWGVDEVLPQMDGPEGTSMIVSNSEKGRELIDGASAALMTAKAVLDYEFMSRRNPNLVSPSQIDKDRRAFENVYARSGFLRVARRWGDLGLRYRLWQLKNFIRNII
jgi:coenzyme F420-reducing hydrogenase beta subunit